jgi:hypothetical protein
MSDNTETRAEVERCEGASAQMMVAPEPGMGR